METVLSYVITNNFFWVILPWLFIRYKQEDNKCREHYFGVELFEGWMLLLCDIVNVFIQ